VPAFGAPSTHLKKDETHRGRMHEVVRDYLSDCNC
jgi:hypothetical protein